MSLPTLLLAALWILLGLVALAGALRLFSLLGRHRNLPDPEITLDLTGWRRGR